MECFLSTSGVALVLLPIGWDRAVFRALRLACKPWHTQYRRGPYGPMESCIGRAFGILCGIAGMKGREAMAEKEGKTKRMALQMELIRKAREDAAFREKLVAKPREAIKEALGIEVPLGV